jgi:RND superfamily putative drug exporter
MAALLARIGGFSARHKWLLLIAWVVLLIIMAGSAFMFSKPMSSDLTVSGLQSITTLNKVDKEFGSANSGDNGGNVVFAAPHGQKLTPADAATIAGLTHDLTEVQGVASATDPFTAAQKTLSPDGRVGYIPVTLSSDKPSSHTIDGIAKAMDTARSSHLQVAATSTLAPVVGASSNQLPGLIIALIVLFITFGTFLAAGLPLLTSLLGLGTSVLGVYAATAFTSVNSIAPTLAILLGLAVGIDYSLFIVSRHRRQLVQGMEVRDSIRLAMGTAGTAVFFAALTVMIALAGLAVVGVDFLSQMGLSAAWAVFIAMLVALTLTPALLSFAGTKLLSRRARKRLASGTPKRSRQFALRWGGLVSRNPIAFLVASLVVLGLIAVPVLTLRLGLPNDGTQPSSSSARQAYDLMSDGFGKGVNGPIVVLANYGESTPSQAEIAALAAKVGGMSDVAHVIPSGIHGHSALLTVIPKSGPSDVATETLVNTLREKSATHGLDSAPTLEVTGATAVAIDISQRLLDALPLYLGLVVGFSFLLLLVVFRSILIPIKATLSFLLSLGAALGATVAVFQWGWLGELFHVDPAGPLLSFLPILVIGVLFGLSMDYEMFLVSGMRERFAHGTPAKLAVTAGFGQGAKVVAAAALIMIGVFGNGALNGGTTIGPIAFALAIGVLIDAFVVRMTLVPAVMTLFGKAAWWLPVWLSRIVPRIDIEGAALERPSVEAEAEFAQQSSESVLVGGGKP